MLTSTPPYARYFTIEKRSHHFLVKNVQGRAREVIDAFARQYVEHSFKRVQGKWKREALKIWAFRTRDGREYRFHANQFDKFISHLNAVGVSSGLYEISERPLHSPREVSYVLRPGRTVRDYQVEPIAYLSDLRPPIAKMLQAPTGTGKTYMAASACSKLGILITAVLKPAYIDKWVADFVELYDLEADDILVIEGSKALRLLIKLAEAGKITASVVIISSRTFQNWIHDYATLDPEHYKLAGWTCDPDMLHELLGTGVRLIDECHEEFHAGFMTDLFTHVPLSISLSATMVSDQSFLTQMYELVYPPVHRYAKIPITRYIASYALGYRFEDPRFLKYKGYGGFYNHNEFEKSILKSKIATQSYLKLIAEAVERHFVREEYKPGDKCLVYCSSIEMCTVVSEYLKGKTFNIEGVDKQFDTRRYVQDDTYDNLMDAEICVSTLKSAGTGHDIAGLTTVIMTVALSSSQSNIQGFGRLRNTVGRKMRFVYFVCKNVDKHLKYHQEKTELLKKRALTHQVIEPMTSLRCS